MPQHRLLALSVFQIDIGSWVLKKLTNVAHANGLFAPKGRDHLNQLLIFRVFAASLGEGSIKKFKTDLREFVR